MKNKTGKKVLYYAILAILLGVFFFSGYQIYSYYSEQNASKSLNEEIVREYTIRKTGEAKEYFEVDFDQLRQQNEDVTAWLYLPDSVINYPVLQHGDNDYYLTRQIDGSYNKNGSIFMDYRNASDFSDRNTIIYGHHMRTGNMFGKLVNFKSDSYYQQHDHMFIMTPQVTYRLELLCGAVVLPGVQANNLSVLLPVRPGQLLLCCAGVYGLLRGLLAVFGRPQRGCFAAVLQIAGATVPVQAYHDTGFTLQDPLAGRRVVLVQYPPLRSRLPAPLPSWPPNTRQMKYLQPNA